MDVQEIQERRPDDPDLMLRHVSRQFPWSLARGLLPTDVPITEVGWQDTQVTARQRRLDRSFLVRVRGELRCKHVEWQRAMTQEVPFRVYEYNSLLGLATVGAKPGSRADLPIDSTVVVLTGPEKPWPQEGCYRTSPSDEAFSGVTFRIDAVYQQTADSLMARGPFWTIFVPLAVDANEVNVERAIGKLRAENNDREFAELAAGLAVMADTDCRGRGLTSVVVKLLKKETVMESWIYKLGKEDGAQEGQAKQLLRLLAAKFGALPQEVQDRVMGAEHAEVDEWALRVLTQNTLADVLAENGKAENAAE